MKKLLLLALTLTACAPQPRPLTGIMTGLCSADDLSKFIGRVATPAMAERARKHSGAIIARIRRPGQIVTMEYDDNRLNVHVDASNRIERFACG